MPWHGPYLFYMFYGTIIAEPSFRLDKKILCNFDTLIKRAEGAINYG